MTPVQEWPAYAVPQHEKQARLLIELRRLSAHHRNGCDAYAAILDKFGFELAPERLEDVPFLPVRLFKHEHLASVPPSEIVKTMTSSGTSGQAVSRIFLDKQTAALQIRALSRIVTDFIGPHRLPMLVIDCRATVAERTRFSARTAGILGFSMFGREVEYALNDDMSLDIERVQAFLARHRERDILLFGFTFMIWQHLVRMLEDTGTTLPLERGILIHGGGWKKLQAEAVARVQFRQRLAATTGIARVHDYYGMVEQTGSIFMECEHGRLHTSSWSEVIIRNPVDFSVVPPGERGIVQLLSVIPHSYPGHSLLSEDIGTIIGHDDCPCGRKGTVFQIHGRVEHAEARGCSDTYSR